MKKMFLVAVMAVCFIGIKAQTDSTTFVQLKDGFFVISNIETAQGMTKDELFKNAVLWISDKFDPNNMTIQTKDSETGLIVVKGISKLAESMDHKLTIQIKDGKYKWEISDINIKSKVVNKSAEERFSNSSDSKEANSTIFWWFKDCIKDLEKKMVTKDNW